MIELTEKQEQEMIDRARAGDPEANYQMSLWALEQAMAEPEEERWNRLAARCLVKSAEAGYAPAKEKMDELLAQTADPGSDAPGQHEAAPAPEPDDTFSPAAASAAAPAAEPAPTPAKEKRAAGAAVTAGLAAVGGTLKKLAAKLAAAVKSGKDGKDGKDGAADGKKTGLFDFSQWDSAKWKRMQIICVIVCVVLALLITIMLISGRKKRNAQPEEEIIIPAAEVVATPVPATPTPTPVPYPPEAVKAEIAAAQLDVYPDDADYVTEATNRTVATSGSSLNVRSGTNASATAVGALPNNTAIEVYAFKNGWALTKVGTVWGWCSNDYLK